jgi:hypothetical protein
MKCFVSVLMGGGGKGEKGRKKAKEEISEKEAKRVEAERQTQRVKHRERKKSRQANRHTELVFYHHRLSL